VSEKTVEQARIDEGAGEQAGQPAREDLERASERALELIEKAEVDGPEDILETLLCSTLLIERSLSISW
jgi:hypothetical protein